MILLVTEKGVSPLTLGERIKKVRKREDLTQQEFADRLGMKRNSIAQVESGRNTSDQTIISICREFGVNEEWLLTGEGEMFAPKSTNALETLVEERGLSHSAYIAIEKFLGLKPELQEGILNYIVDVAAAINADTAPAVGHDAAPTSEDLHAELDRQIAIEQEAAEKSEVS